MQMCLLLIRIVASWCIIQSENRSEGSLWNLSLNIVLNIGYEKSEVSSAVSMTSSFTKYTQRSLSMATAFSQSWHTTASAGTPGLLEKMSGIQHQHESCSQKLPFISTVFWSFSNWQVSRRLLKAITFMNKDFLNVIFVRDTYENY